jgi:hypothetical protein
MKKLILLAAMIGLVSWACGTTPVAMSSPSPQPSSSASPVASPSPSPAVPAGFALSDFSGGSTATSTVTAVRIGQHDGYDRFVIEFSGGVPSYSVTRQAGVTFTRSPKGDTVTLYGSAGVVIRVHSIANWTSYMGPMAFKPGYSCIREARMTENFEGYQSWALGIAGTPALRVFTMSGPDRLVVDVATVS